MKRLRLLPLILLALLSCESGPGSTVQPEQVEVSFSIVSGGDQTGPTHAELPEPLVVRAEVGGKAWKGQVVNFVVTEGEGSVFAGAALTDNKGLAQDFWTLGGPGPQEIQVRAVDTETGAKLVFATFEAIAFAPVAISTTSLPDGTSGSAYSQTLATTGGDGTYAWVLINSTTLPAGLALNAVTGEISGTPLNDGKTDFEVEVTSAGQTATKALAITITPWNVSYVSGPIGAFGSVWGTSDEDVFAAGWEVGGLKGAIAHFDGEVWELMDLPDGTPEITSIWGFGLEGVYATARHKLLFYNGKDPWEVVFYEPQGGALDAIWGTASDNVHAVGAHDGKAVIVHFDGTIWEIDPYFDGFGVVFSDIWGTATDNILAVGGTPLRFAVHFDGVHWLPVFPDPPGGGDGLESVRGLPDGTMYAVGGVGQAYRIESEAWHALDDTPPGSPPTRCGYHGVWPFSRTQVVFLGNDCDEPLTISRMFVYDGSEWTALELPADVPFLWGLWGAPNGDLFAVGNDGVVLRRPALD